MCERERERERERGKEREYECIQPVWIQKILSHLSFFTIVCLQPETTYVYNVVFYHYYVFDMYVSEGNKRRQKGGGLGTWRTG